MSNPYDPYNSGGQEQGSNPYGQPYGNQPYGAGSFPGDPGGPGGGVAKTDAVSITGFVLSLTCCLSLFGAILGIVGLGRTKNGKRKGRWAAVAATVVGLLGTLAFGAIIIGVVMVAKSAVTPDNAEVGQCVSVDDNNTDEIFLREVDCDSSHDGEITYVGKYSEIEGTPFEPQDINDLSDSAISLAVCTSLMPEADSAAVAEALGDNADYTFAMEDPGSPSADDPFLCYVKDRSGDQIDSQILD